jgi:tripartite-type tricarboxylate transporter receptor subunit TctC
MRSHRPLLLAMGFFAIWSWTSQSQAQSVADFYKGKQVDLITTGGAGTSDDTWARMLSKYLQRHIPGNPPVVVKNMPGGGHIKGSHYLFNVAPKDGTTIGIMSRNIPTSYALGNDQINFDVQKFEWLASTDQPMRICVALPSAKVQKGEDLFHTELIVAGAGAGSAQSITPHLLNGALGMKFNIVEGYKSSTESMLALDRGEVHGLCLTQGGIENQRPGAIAQGKLKVLFQFSRKPLPTLNAPSIYEFTKTEEQRQILAFFDSNTQLGRPMLAPPGVPADRVAALRTAFNTAFADPDLIRDVEKQGLEHSPITGQELKERIDELLATPKHIITKTSELLGTNAGTQ